MLDDLDVRRVSEALRLARRTVALRTRLRTLAWLVSPTLALVTFLLVSLLR